MTDYIELLIRMIQTPSFSEEENQVDGLLRDFVQKQHIPFEVGENNTWMRNRYWEEGKPVILLNSHVDTVKPVKHWTEDPFGARITEGRIIGLGSNDAGASLISLLAVFCTMYNRQNLPYNLIYAASAEEEISGPKGMEALIHQLGKIDLAIIGEPTRMHMAIAEKGLMVLDCTAFGKAGHAARNEGENALYKAIDAINTLRNFSFPKRSEVLGEVKLTVTQIQAGYQHNVVPDSCSFVVDVRTNECYSNTEVCEIVRQLISVKAEPRSFKLNSSGIPVSHPIVQRGKSLGRDCYGSPTTSDQAVIPYPSIKIGPGDSARSHTADEYILISEIEEGFKIYMDLLEDLNI